MARGESVFRLLRSQPCSVRGSRRRAGPRSHHGVQRASPGTCHCVRRSGGPAGVDRRAGGNHRVRVVDAAGDVCGWTSHASVDIAPAIHRKYREKDSMSDAQAIPAIKRESGERFDVIVAALTAVATSVSFILAILTPPKKGRFCAPGCVEYPYTDIAAYIPRDFLWMYPALFPAPLFVILLIGVRERAALDRKPFGQAAVAFGAVAATILTAVYFIQLRSVQPTVLRGELDGMAPW